MIFRSESRKRAGTASRVLAALLTLLLFALLTAVSVSAFVLYRILAPAAATPPETSRLLGNPSEVEFPVPGGDTRKGLFYPGRKSAPTVILCHGFGSRSVEILTLAAGLQENRFNVFLFDFSGHGSAGGRTSLGYRESGELLAALETVARRDDVDPRRFGVWGADLGAHAALAAALQEGRIRALVLDSVYDHPHILLRHHVERSGLSVVPLVGRFSHWGFTLFTWPHRGQPPLSADLGRLEGVAKLFIGPLDGPALRESTLELFLASPEPREQEVVQKGGYVGMLDSDKRLYENRVVRFFLQHLPPVT